MNKKLKMIIVALLISIPLFTLLPRGTKEGISKRFEVVFETYKGEGILLDLDRSSLSIFNKGDVKYHEVYLYKGSVYYIIGFGDETVSDIDMAVFDEKNNLVSAASKSEGIPMVKVNPSWSGKYKVVMRLTKSSDPDAYIMSVLGY